MEKDVEIGIFGGTGIYDSGLLENAQEIEIETPYGKPSDTITVGTFKGRKIAFLPRHGKKHTIPPHMINFKANIWAFKELGITRIIAPSAVGSLKQELEPGQLCIANAVFRFYKIKRWLIFRKGKSHPYLSSRSILSRTTIFNSKSNR